MDVRADQLTRVGHNTISNSKNAQTVVFYLEQTKNETSKIHFSIRFKHGDSLYDQKQIILHTHEPLIGSKYGVFHHDLVDHN